MPLPKPNKGESQSSFMKRCMSAQSGENKPNNQKVAICIDRFKKMPTSTQVVKTALLQAADSIGNIPCESTKWNGPDKNLTEEDLKKCCIIKENKGFLPIRKNPGAPINTNALIEAARALSDTSNEELESVRIEARVDAKERIRWLSMHLSFEFPDDIF